MRKRRRNPLDVFKKLERVNKRIKDNYTLKDEEKIDMSGDLKYLWDQFKENQYILISGSAGTGKSRLIKRFYNLLENHTSFDVSLVAPTGLASFNIGGRTLHSWFGFGLARQSLPIMKQRIPNGTIFSIQTTTVLIIDEISMVDGDFFEKISEIIKFVTGVRNPFGNIKVIMCGDFLQLPPVNGKYVFETETWKSMKVARLWLRHIYRQNDIVLKNILNNVRIGRLTDRTKELLHSRFRTPDFDCITLTSYRREALNINVRRLELLSNNNAQPIQTFENQWLVVPSDSKKGISKRDRYKVDKLMTNTEKLANNFPVESKLKLCVGCKVMSRVNLFAEKVYNGLIGTVVDINLNPNTVDMVFENGTQHIFEVHNFTFKVGRTAEIVFRQIPLSLAYAITIHKSQGVTLDYAKISTNTFTHGQFYVGISRVRALSGLYLYGNKKIKIAVCEKAKEFEQDPLLKMFKLDILFRKKSAVSKVFQRNQNIADFNIFKIVKSFL
jgi:ATP-dependent DNA helicase PIF1